MNRKGFTLIELLATITILSMIMLLAVPNIMSTIDNNKKRTYIEDAKKMITLTDYRIRKDTDIDLDELDSCDALIFNLSSFDLTDFSEGPEGGKYSVDESYVEVVKVGEDTNGYEYQYFVTLKEIYNGKSRGVNFISKEELNDEKAITKVTSNFDNKDTFSECSEITVKKMISYQ